MPILLIPAFRWPRQMDFCELQSSQGYTVRPKTNKTKNKNPSDIV